MKLNEGIKLKDLTDIPALYDSPISMAVQKISATVAEKADDAVYQAVLKTGIIVDKDKLLQALDQDKERYQDAYHSGYMTALHHMKQAEVIPLDEVMNHDAVWLDTVDVNNKGNEFHYVRQAFVMIDHGSFIEFCYPVRKVSFATAWPKLFKDQYDKVWRCWTNKPTEQQMIDRDDEVPFCEE